MRTPTLVLAVALATPGLASLAQGQVTVPYPGGDPIYACSDPEPTLRRVHELRSRDATVDTAAAVPTAARLTGWGEVVVLDATAGEVVVLDASFETRLRFGRRGDGPGELGRPVDVSGGPSDTWLVLDFEPPALEVFDRDGRFLRSISLPISGKHLDSDSVRAYVSTPAIAIRPHANPVLVAVDVVSGETETLLSFNPAWIGRPPVYTNPFTETIPRVGADGGVYLGFVESSEIWRVSGPGDAGPVVRGCIPGELLALYRHQEPGKMARGGILISDFQVRDDGRIVVRGGLVHEDGSRPWQLYAADGSLLRAWRLGPPRLLDLRSSISRDDPDRQLSWNEAHGILRLLEVQSEGHGRQERR